MKLLALYWSFLVIGYIFAWKTARKGRSFPWVATAMLGTVYGLCFIMGLRMGSNEQVIANLGTIGLMSLVITIFCIVGSMGAIFLTRKIFGMDRKGRFIADLQDASGEQPAEALRQTDDQEGMDLKSTFIILGLVAAGMLIGAFFILGRAPRTMTLFDVATNDTLIVLLCILMFFVGLDLGGSEEVIRSVRRAGLRVLAFPVATMIGTMVAGVAACLLMGLTLKEGSAICIGFGWYSYAPIVIASAGQQYMIASAISFMHNVIREVTGIIFIPLVAKKIGYMESTGVPGIAAMDVCLPIVERSCGPNAVVYAFATGVIMCIVTSLGVPLIMGV
ncbi:MAG: lysine exporter LysO family protein [Clostridia bacterium]|nr:lysine exporter LysO family protein [Clostridia bacterium]